MKSSYHKNNYYILSGAPGSGKSTILDQLKHKGYICVNEPARESNEAHVSEKSRLKLVSEVFFLTITNPMTILSFVGIFASIGTATSSTLESITMVVGIFLGSMTWWCVLGSAVTKIKHKLPKTWLERIKWVSCCILASFGLLAIVGSLMH